MFSKFDCVLLFVYRCMCIYILFNIYILIYFYIYSNFFISISCQDNKLFCSFKFKFVICYFCLILLQLYFNK